MAGKTLEAKLRIAADVAQAIAALKGVKKEILALQTTTPAGGDEAAAVRAAVAPAKARSAAEKQATGDVKEAARDAARTQVQTARDAAAAVKAAVADKLKAEREAAAEAKRLAAEAARDKLKAEREVDAAARRAQQQVERQQRATANLQKNAQRQLPAQITDIVTGLTSGQSVGTVAIQQGGQILDSFGGAKAAVQGVLQLLTPIRVGIGAAAGAALLFAQQIAAGYRETQQLNKGLALTGNTAGTSAGQIDQLAHRISAAQGSSIGFVRELLAQLVTVSGQTDTTLESTASAAAALARLTGQSSEDAVKQFADQAEGVTAWATKSNRAYNFLTAEQVQYIRTLEQQGRTAEAIRFTNEQLAATLQQRTAVALGAIERGWIAAGTAMSKFLDWMKSIGREETAVEKLAKLQKQLDDIDARQAGRQRRGTILPRASVDPEGVQAARDDTADKVANVNRDLLRASEKAIAQRQEQQKIEQQSAAAVQASAAAALAAAQRELAQQQALLDRRQDMVEAAYAREEISAAERAAKLSAIDAQRAQDQVRYVQAQIAAQAQLVAATNTPEEKKSAEAQLVQLQAQLVDAKSRVASAIAEGRRVIAAEIARLKRDVDQRAAELAAGQAPKDASADPAERARRVAEAATQQARRELQDLERDARNSAAAGADAELQRLQQRDVQLARSALDEAARKERLRDLNAQLGEQLDALAVEEQRGDQAAAAGALTTQDAEDRKFAARRANKDMLEAILALIRLESSSAPAEQNAAEQAALRVKDATKTISQAELSLRSSGQGVLAQFFGDIETRSKSAKAAVLDLVRGIGQAFLNLINQKLAERLFQGFTQAAGGTWWQSLIGAVNGSGSTSASVKHSGGLIGAAGGVARAIAPALVAGAQVLHTGGLVAPNERVVVAEVGEEMLTADDPRHIKNFSRTLLAGGVSVNANYTITGAGGSQSDQAASLQELQRMMDATVERWALNQRRTGGILSGLGRG